LNPAKEEAHDATRNKIAEPQTAFGPGRCNDLYPASRAPQLVAGTPIVNDVIKCRLKDVDPRDYRVSFATAQWDRLKRIFPEGVCDWSTEGVAQRDAETWASFGPSRDNLIFDVTKGNSHR